MAGKQELCFLVFLTVSLVSISSSNARPTESFGKLTRREPVVPEISVAPAPSTAELSPALSPSEYGGYGLYSSEDADASEQTPRYETGYDDVSDQTPRYETRYDDASDQTPQYDDDQNPKTDNDNYDDDKQQQQGLSDTRFLDNGRYYHDVTTENDNSYYGNNNNNNNDLGEAQRYEFDSMEEYQKYQEAHPYLP